MTETGFRYGWIVALLVGLPLAACHDSAPDKPAGTKAAVVPPKKAKLNDDMVAAVSAGKSSTVVGVYFTLGSAPTIDSALPVSIAIVPHQDFTGLQARFSTQGDGLRLMSGDLLERVANIEAESSLEHKLVLMPKKEGVYMVSVNLETEDSEGSVSRIFSIPVIVAPANGATQEGPASTPPASTTK
jgi:hypothetical protein